MDYLPSEEVALVDLKTAWRNKMNFTKSYFDRFGNVLKLNEKQINAVYKRLVKWLPEATKLIEISFVTEENRIAYTYLVTNRVKQFTS